MKVKTERNYLVSAFKKVMLKSFIRFFLSSLIETHHPQFFFLKPLPNMP